MRLEQRVRTSREGDAPDVRNLDATCKPGDRPVIVMLCRKVRRIVAVDRLRGCGWRHKSWLYTMPVASHTDGQFWSLIMPQHESVLALSGVGLLLLPFGKGFLSWLSIRFSAIRITRRKIISTIIRSVPCGLLRHRCFTGHDGIGGGGGALLCEFLRRPPFVPNSWPKTGDDRHKVGPAFMSPLPPMLHWT